MKKENTLKKELNLTKQERRQHCVQGQVQGVGFRPFVFRLAHAHSLSGFVNNTSDGVFIEVQGKQINLDTFEADFYKKLPPLAKISFHSIKQVALLEENSQQYSNNAPVFSIHQSDISSHDGNTVLISPDSAICPDCQADLQNTSNHHYAYPFTNCTNCGPRYTITKSIPYDRAFTSMACFKMCDTCQKEYDNPLDRRFHAQPNACESCGPKLWITKNSYFFRPYKLYYALILFLKRKRNYKKEDTAQDIFSKKILTILKSYKKNSYRTLLSSVIIAQSQKLLNKGKILAIKALGGFQLACDAYNYNAIENLRKRKNRPHKAFALMVENLEEAKKIAYISKEAESLLCSAQAPIVLCPKKEKNTKYQLPENIAPDTQRIGIMLAYTPLHKLLFQSTKNNNYPVVQALIMTSANTSGEPICIKNRQALHKLAHITDYFLFHNRDILVRVDDSVCLALGRNEEHKTQTIQENIPPLFKELTKLDTPLDSTITKRHKEHAPLVKTLFFRRARGYVPTPTLLPSILNTIDKIPSIFSSGAFLKNTFCLTRQSHAFVSQHMGDLDNLSVMEFYEETYNHLKNLLEIQNIKAVVCDTHPDFPSTHFAQKVAEEFQAPLYRLQHHFAHAYAVLAEHEEYDLSPTLALALDGTGHGLDGTSWGAELLYLDPKNYSYPSVPQQFSSTNKEHFAIYNFQNPLMLRLGRLSPMPLIGGELAIKEPWRIAYGMYLECLEKNYLEEDFQNFSPPWLENTVCKEQMPILTTLLQKNINCPRSSGCGRIFDAISALLGLCSFSTYEGQAPIKLEHIATQIFDTIEISRESPLCSAFYKKTSQEGKSLNFLKRLWKAKAPNLETLAKDTHFTPLWEVDSHALFAQTYKERKEKLTTSQIAFNFHTRLVSAFTQMTHEAKEAYDINKIVLCGGVMNNELLLSLFYHALRDVGFQVLLPKNMPSGDGAISLGQAFYGVLQTQKKEYSI